MTKDPTSRKARSRGPRARAHRAAALPPQLMSLAGYRRSPEPRLDPRGMLGELERQRRTQAAGAVDFDRRPPATTSTSPTGRSTSTRRTAPTRRSTIPKETGITVNYETRSTATPRSSARSCRSSGGPGHRARHHRDHERSELTALNQNGWVTELDASMRPNFDANAATWARDPRRPGTSSRWPGSPGSPGSGTTPRWCQGADEDGRPDEPRHRRDELGRHAEGRHARPRDGQPRDRPEDVQRRRWDRRRSGSRS